MSTADISAFLNLTNLKMREKLLARSLTKSSPFPDWTESFLLSRIRLSVTDRSNRSNPRNLVGSPV